MSEIASIHTCCKNCVFAKYDGKTQTDCYLGFIDIFKDHNISVLEAYDEDKEFYIINDKKCIGYREKDWIANNNLDPNDVNQQVNKFNELNKINYISIIDTKNLSFQSLELILADLKKQSYSPKKIFIIRYNTNTDFSFDKLKPLLDSTNLPWKIQTALDKDTSIDYFIGTILQTQKARFVLLINQYSPDINNLIWISNDTVCKKLQQLFVFRNHNKSCIMFSSTVYKFNKIEGVDLLNNDEHHTII